MRRMNQGNNHYSFFSTHKWLIIILLIVAFIALGSKSSNDYVDDSYEPSGEIHNIKVDTGDADIKIKQGDKFHVSGKYLREDDYEFTQDGDTLKVTCGNHSVFDFVFFNFDGSFFFGNKSPQITITVPQTQFNNLIVEADSGSFSTETDLTATKSNIQLKSGEINLEKISGDDLSLSIVSGDLSVKNIDFDVVDVDVKSGDCDLGYIETSNFNIKVSSGNISFKSLEADVCTMDVSSGEITGNNVKINNIDGHVASGNLELRGQLNGKSKLTCDSGDVELKLDGNVNDYYYELNGDDIEINNHEYGDKYKSDVVLDKQLYLECSSGNIDVSIH